MDFSPFYKRLKMTNFPKFPQKFSQKQKSHSPKKHTLLYMQKFSHYNQPKTKSKGLLVILSDSEVSIKSKRGYFANAQYDNALPFLQVDFSLSSESSK